MPFTIRLYLLKSRRLGAVPGVQYIPVIVIGNWQELQLAPDIAACWWQLSSEYHHILLRHRKGGKSTLGSKLEPTDKRRLRSYG